MNSPGFSVCSRVRETPEVLERFAHYYLSLGAERVRLFFDGTEEEAVVPKIPGVELTVCDEAFWIRHLGRRPANTNEAMRTVFGLAHETSTSDWQYFCDADEFLVTKVPIPRILASLPPETESLRVMNAEAVWGPGDRGGSPFGCSYFRTPLSPRRERLLRLLMPSRRNAMLHKGLAGHSSGKQFLKAGTVVDAHGHHWSERKGERLGQWAHDLGFGQDKIYLAHFDAISEDRWVEKWRRRISGELPSIELRGHRKAQQDAIAAGAAKGSLPDIFHDMYTVGRYEVALLGLLGGIRRAHLFPDRTEQKS